MARLASSHPDPPPGTLERSVPTTRQLVPVLMSLAILGPLSIDMYLPA